ncbi:MAG: hypothetical protein GY697_24160 [Desulfobacterales bacterium]|nr:hypothetical protein [Desulfobacterales bacterium]
MPPVDKSLLMIDAVVNLALGILLLLFPAGIGRLLGAPPTDTNFYASILGAVLFGIGIALLIEYCGEPMNLRGLGLEGAIVINFCGAGILLCWLLLVPFNIPVRGKVILWTIAISVIGIGVVELLARRANTR